MISFKMLSDIDRRLKEITSINNHFGGKSILLVGDLYQLPPVGGLALYRTDYKRPDCIRGHELLSLFTKVFFLKSNMRQKNDIAFSKFLQAIREGCITEEQYNFLTSRFHGIPPIVDDNQIVLVPTNARAQSINFKVKIILQITCICLYNFIIV